MASCPQETLLAQACTNGFLQLAQTNPALAQAIFMQLLCNVSAGGVAGIGLAGAGSPEGVVTASPGTTYLNTADESFWVKKTGTGNTGWIELIGV
jgi:hypothetical protein